MPMKADTFPESRRRIRIPIQTPITATTFFDDGNGVDLANYSPFEIAEMDGYMTGESTLEKPAEKPILANMNMWNTSVEGSTIDVIFWSYRNDWKDFQDSFDERLRRCTLSELRQHRKTFLKFDNCPPLLYDCITRMIYDKKETEARAKEIMAKMNKLADTAIWFRVKVRKFETDDEGCPVDFPLGKYEEVYVECEKLNELDEVMTFHYGVNVFDLDIFELTIYDGDSAFERTVNNSKRSYQVLNKNNVQESLATYNTWLNA